LPTIITPTQVNGAKKLVLARNNGLEDAIAVDSDSFADDLDFLVDKRSIPALLVQIQNTGATNGLSFEVYGTIDPGTTAPAFTLKDWELVTSGSGNIALTNNKIFDLTLYYTFILIRLKRQSAGLDTTAKIVTTSGRR